MRCASGVRELSSKRAYEEYLAELRSYREKARLYGGKEAVEKLHKEGRMTARERLEGLLDPGSLVELDAFMTHRFTDFGMDKRKGLGDGVIAGCGLVNGRPVCVYAEDSTFMGGSLGEAHLQKMSKTLDLACRMSINGFIMAGKKANPFTFVLISQAVGNDGYLLRSLVLYQNQFESRPHGIGAICV